MNFDRLMHGRMTINGQKIKLGHAALPTLIQRFAEQARGAKVSTSKIAIVFESSTEPLPDAGILDRETQLMHEMGLMIAPDDEEVFEGVTAARVAVVMESLEYREYAPLCDPQKRMGIDSVYVEECRISYEEKFPDCAPHFPRYVES